MTAITARPFRPEDRAAVRRICHRVGYMGEPASWYWPHVDSFADVWTAYYTDHEPESLFVAVDGNAVVGYLSGCIDSRRAPDPAQALSRSVLRHALFLRRGTASFLLRGIRDSLREGPAPSGTLEDPRWPSHLHINLLAEARGHGAGAALMEAWFARLREAGSPGCHLTTMLENRPAVAFFERMGFERHGAPHLLPGMRTPTGGRHHLQFMVRAV
ncbi:MAG: GNAT family N-acetyltransferase [Thermodesulfobacteriota bacterium]